MYGDPLGPMIYLEGIFWRWNISASPETGSQISDEETPHPEHREVDRLVDQQVKPFGHVSSKLFKTHMAMIRDLSYPNSGRWCDQKRYMTINIKHLVCIIRYLYYSCHYLMFKIDLARRERGRERERKRKRKRESRWVRRSIFFHSSGHRWRFPETGVPLNHQF
jgi:hypothetical protein